MVPNVAVKNRYAVLVSSTLILLKHADRGVTYLSVDGVKVDVCFLGPLLPELRVIQRNVCAVLGGHKAGFGEGGALALALDGDGGGTPLQDLVNVLFAETAALVILIHDCSIRAFPQEILNLLLRELLDL